LSEFDFLIAADAANDYPGAKRAGSSVHADRLALELQQTSIRETNALLHFEEYFGRRKAFRLIPTGYGLSLKAE